MKAEEFSKNILGVDPQIRFAGIMEKSGHCTAGGMREGKEEFLRGRSPEISFAQTAYVVDLRKMFSSELGELNYVIMHIDRQSKVVEYSSQGLNIGVFCKSPPQT